MRKKGSIGLGQNKDVTFKWVTRINPELEQWRLLAEEWVSTQIRSKGESTRVMGKFLYHFLHERNLPKVPAEFLRRNYSSESFYSVCLSKFVTKKEVMKSLTKVEAFLDWVLNNFLSVEDDFGNKVVPIEFHNPISLELPSNSVHRGELDESDKNTLPYKYIKDLREIICPSNSNHFDDWKWAQKISKMRKGGNWYIVDFSIIDFNDKDCVWRKRQATKYEKERNGLPDEVYELWFPGRAVALLLKLLLPLRTYQVRMLDSGEADTYRYDQADKFQVGVWSSNNGPLCSGTEKYPERKGVFRRFIDQNRKTEMTGFYINTNKTADISKDELSRGYEIPWQYEEALYWLAKLRCWQEKYNPIVNSTPWSKLDYSHFGFLKDSLILKQMGSTCFLFRDATQIGEDKSKPIIEQSIGHIWWKLLFELEKNVNAHSDNENELQLKFIKNCQTTYYPLHSLRVSLITAFALEGGVPMPILSKCIAGHSRLVMTLYYTKVGITYVTDMMKEGEKKLEEKKQDNYQRWLREADIKQIESYCAFNDAVSMQKIINYQQSGIGFIKDDKGICIKGCMGCNSGGININENTGRATYIEVPGYPEQNCVRCRWFITGPAFLLGLTYHFNIISYNISEASKRLGNYENDVVKLQNAKIVCEQSDIHFISYGELVKKEKYYEQEMKKVDKLANDWHATIRLIDRCIAINSMPNNEGKTQLLPIGTLEDLKVAIDECTDEFSLLQNICSRAEVFTEEDASKAILQRSQILDVMLAYNGKKPIYLTLTLEQQLKVGNELTRLLITRAGSIKAAVPFVEGRKQLAELGISDEVNAIIQMTIGQSIKETNAENQELVKFIESSERR